MTATQQTVLILFGAVAFAHPIVMRLLAERIDSSRQAMIALGEELIASGGTSANAKRYIRCMIEDATDWRFMALVATYMPMFLCRVVLNRIFSWPKLAVPPEINGNDMKEKFQRFNNYHVESIAAANPLFTIIATIEVACLVAVLFPLGRLTKAISLSFGATMGAGRWLHHQHQH